MGRGLTQGRVPRRGFSLYLDGAAIVAVVVTVPFLPMAMASLWIGARGGDEIGARMAERGALTLIYCLWVGVLALALVQRFDWSRLLAIITFSVMAFALLREVVVLAPTVDGERSAAAIESERRMCDSVLGPLHLCRGGYVPIGILGSLVVVCLLGWPTAAEDLLEHRRPPARWPRRQGPTRGERVAACALDLAAARIPTREALPELVSLAESQWYVIEGAKARCMELLLDHHRNPVVRRAHELLVMAMVDTRPTAPRPWAELLAIPARAGSSPGPPSPPAASSSAPRAGAPKVRRNRPSGRPSRAGTRPRRG